MGISVGRRERQAARSKQVEGELAREERVGSCVGLVRKSTFRLFYMFFEDFFVCLHTQQVTVGTDINTGSISTCILNYLFKYFLKTFILSL